MSKKELSVLPDELMKGDVILLPCDSGNPHRLLVEREVPDYEAGAVGVARVRRDTFSDLPSVPAFGMWREAYGEVDAVVFVPAAPTSLNLKVAYEEGEVTNFVKWHVPRYIKKGRIDG